jgi:hypothetical protein
VQWPGDGSDISETGLLLNSGDKPMHRATRIPIRRIPIQFTQHRARITRKEIRTRQTQTISIVMQGQGNRLLSIPHLS